MTQPVDGSSAALSCEETVTTIPGCRFIPDFLDRGRADALLTFLLSAVDWRTEDIVLFGRRRRVPRLVAWFGDEGLCYRYSGADHPTRGWPAELLPLRDAVAGELPEAPNFVLLNRYRSGRDAMGWHTDNEAMLSDLIGSLSLGAPRRFLVRPVRDEGSRAFELTHGSLLLMDRHLPHCLPRTRREVAERINLSFRTVP
jgi:alkylated DNA repair dioxygenase AlkB